MPSAAVQSALLRWLGLVSSHYAACVFALPPSVGLDCTRLLVSGAMLAITDAVLRVATPDKGVDPALLQARAPESAVAIGLALRKEREKRA